MVTLGGKLEGKKKEELTAEAIPRTAERTRRRGV
jgi:hypothetical protein